LDNPAKLSPELARLFPAEVVAAEVTVPVGRSVLTSLELQFIAHCADKRIHDFAAGRACAHRALSELGIVDFSLLAGKQREPLWPDSIVGSITHTHSYGAAVVARQRNLRALGIDCEVIDSVDEDLWSRICTPVELERLAGLPAGERGRQASLIFAAKEAFYKCQFPLTREWVGFEDVVIEPLVWPASEGALRILPQTALPLEEATVAGLVCRFQFRDRWVLAGVATTA
jgi:4'-phosphopantetheinyl transferase EntD